FQFKHRQRNADVVVETPFARKGNQLLIQDRGDQLLGRGLAVRTANRDEWQRKISPVARGQIAQRFARVLNDNHRAVFRTGRNALTLNQERARAFAQDIRYEVVPIKVVAAQGDKQIARLDLPRIGANATDDQIVRRREQVSRARAGHKLNGAWFHSAIQLLAPAGLLRRRRTAVIGSALAACINSSGIALAMPGVLVMAVSLRAVLPVEVVTFAIAAA